MNIVLTGADSGLGFALKHKLKEDHLVFPFRGDLYDPDSIQIEKERLCKATAGTIHVLINCAGVNYINWIEETPIDDWG